MTFYLLIKGRKLLSLIVLGSVLLGSCGKEENLQDDNESPEVKAILSITQDAAGGGGPYTINVIEPTGSNRWRKSQWGFLNGSYIKGGLIYLTGSAADYTNGKIGVYDMVTGTEQWLKVTPKEYYYSPFVRNDTLFCSVSVEISASASEAYLAAYKASTGQLYWKKKVADRLYPLNPIYNSEIVYFLTWNQAVGSGGTLKAFNLNTQSVIWTNSNIDGGSPMYEYGDLLIIQGVQPATGIYAVNKSTGTISWIMPRKQLSAHYFQNGIINGICEIGNTTEKGIYAYDCNSRTLKWSVNMPDLNSGGGLATSENGGLIFNHTDANGWFIQRYNSANGQLIWTTRANFSELVKQPRIIGDKIYSFNTNFIGGVITNPKVMCYKLSTGEKLDSVLLPNNEKNGFSIITSYN